LTVATLPFFMRTYDETSALMVAARDYLGNARPASAPGLTSFERLAINCEAMRLVARLTQVMAWLLAQRAVHAGEITAADAASEQYRLSGSASCLAETKDGSAPLPPRLYELMAESRQLYVRVARLDAMTRRVVH
jgi:regulator of CtrA degradation